ncbi:DUF6457 domain-containing protein [Pseudactinotalea sp. HY160]|uniref:DUF6457 domain-containing protein n=1 Tax=Pseudactinotalea sp. HY160 TaxID=2654490 RepID=UPI001D141A26|nr:DUF6457 domain-containing protein [Pseudactinotalea sp. HY160]
MSTNGDMGSDIWRPWIERAAAAAGVDPACVDVPLIHDLTKQVAHRYDRPMAPVSSFLLGVALGRAAGDGGADQAALARELVDRIVATLPEEAADPGAGGDRA